jgi:hypothetical protein
MFSRIFVVLIRQRSATVKEHESYQIDGHPTFWFIRNNDLVKVFKNLLSKWLQKSKRKNHVELLDHDRWERDLSK